MRQPRVLYPFVGSVRRGSWTKEFRTLAQSDVKAEQNIMYRAFLIVNGFPRETLKKKRKEWTQSEKTMEADLRAGYRYVKEQYVVYGVRRVVETR
jgi:hypothetical protein